MLDDFKEEQAIMYKLLCNSVNKNKTSHAYLLEFNGFSTTIKQLLFPSFSTSN